MKEHFNLFGFKIKTKSFLITTIIAAAVLLLLLGIDALWLDISWYGVIIGTGFLMAIAVATANAKLRGFDSDFIYDLIWWVFPLSIIGARAYYVIFDWDTFDTFWEMLAIWHGGMAIYGGVIGGLIGLIICCLIKKKNIISAMDIAAPSLILGQSIGRWGNFINVEVYGFEVTNKAWQWFPFAVKVKDGTYHLATFFYESVLNLGGFFLLLTMLRRSKEKGIVVSTYLLFYGLVRICLESLRIPEYILYIEGTNIPISSVVSACVILIGAVWLAVILIRKYVNIGKLKRVKELASGIDGTSIVSETETYNKEEKSIKSEANKEAKKQVIKGKDEAKISKEKVENKSYPAKVKNNNQKTSQRKAKPKNDSTNNNQDNKLKKDR